MGDQVYVTAGGDTRPLRDEFDKAKESIKQVGDALDETGKKAAGVSGSSGTAGGARGLDQYRFSVDSLGRSMLENLGSFGAFMVTLNSTFGVIGEVTGVIGGAVDGFLQFAETVGGVVVDAVRAAADEIGNLTQQVFDLNKGTEQQTGSWRYIYGQGGANAGQITQQLMAWTSKFSMDVPYTRQDLMGAVTALGRAGLDATTVENSMSDIADLGALNPQRTLTQAAWSIQGAMHGYSRMLKYDYGIDPAELEAFGYDQSNPETTLLPALHAYLQARGMLGAAKYAATQTFWGAESSFVDRLQNFGLQVGGTDLSGNIAKGSMFGVMKDDLVGLSKWWDDHSTQINQVAHLFGDILGGAVKDLTKAFEGLMTGLHASGLDKIIENMLESLGKWLNDPAVSSGLKALTEAFGQLAGAAIGDALQAASTFFEGLASTGVPQELFNGLINVMTSMGNFFKEHRADINAFFYQLGTATGKGLKDIENGFSAIGQSLTQVKNSMTPQDWKNLQDAASFAIKTILDAIAGLLIVISAFVTQLRNAIDLWNQLQNITHGAFGGYAGSGSGNSGGEDSGGNTGSEKGGGTKAHLNAAIHATNQALSGAGGSVLVGSSGGGGNVSTSSSSTSNLYGGTSHTAITIHAAAEARIAEIAKSVLRESDLAQNIFSRRPGGYRPGVFGSLG